MKRLVGMLPVIIVSAYFTVGNMTGFRFPVMKGLTLLGFALLAVVLYLRKSGLSAIDRGFLIFLAFNTVVFWFLPPLPRKIIAESNVGILYLVLFAVTALPALFGKRYFTDYFAKKMTPAAVWETEIFRTVNRRMTWVWAALFAVSALVAILPARFLPAGGPLGNILFSMVIPTLLMVGIGIPFNKRYPRYYQQKIGLDPVGTAAEIRAEGPAPLGQVINERQQEEKMSQQLGQVTNEQQQEGKISGQLRVTAINGSPHGAIGNTSQMIRMVGEGLAREGIVLEEIRLTERDIAYCIGCAVCLEKGVCWRRDDHAGITEALLAADGIILASPVYFKHVTAQMKTFYRPLPGVRSQAPPGDETGFGHHGLRGSCRYRNRPLSRRHASGIRGLSTGFAGCYRHGSGRVPGEGDSGGPGAGSGPGTGPGDQRKETLPGYG